MTTNEDSDSFHLDNSRKRKVTEDRSTRGKRTKIENKSRKRSKDLQLQKDIKWSDYDINFPTFGNIGRSEMRRFLQRIEKVSEYGQTTIQLLGELCNKSKLDLLAQLQINLPNRQNDFILLTDAKSLQDELRKPFKVPLLYRATTNHPSLCRTDFSIQAFLQHIRDDKDASISVYDYSIEDSRKRIYQTNVCYLLSQFQEDRVGEAVPLNFLDIENRTGIQFCPTQILLQDILIKLDSRKEPNKGKTGSEWEAKPTKEFFLLSQKNAISTIHVDTGGSLTWILILEGRKIWYYQPWSTPQTIRWLGIAGSQAPGGNWKKVELRPGDLMIMPPGLKHSVFTPEKTLAVGGPFYTMANLDKSIEMVKLQEDHPSISNEDLTDSVYHILDRIVERCDDIATSTEKASIISSCLLFREPLPVIGALKKLSHGHLEDILRSRGTAFDAEASTNDLIKYLSINETSARRKFREQLKAFCERNISKYVSVGI